MQPSPPTLLRQAGFFPRFPLRDGVLPFSSLPPPGRVSYFFAESTHDARVPTQSFFNLSSLPVNKRFPKDQV